LLTYSVRQIAHTKGCSDRSGAVKMKVSFLVPSKNRLELLKRCLHSIRAQKRHFDFEVIVSDNASADDYRTYINKLADPRIIYLRQSYPLPVTDNWRAALSHATGDYVLMLGDDDALTPDFSTIVEPFLRPDGADVAYLGAYHYCYPNVMKGSEAGYLAVYGCEILPNEKQAFCLLPHYARELAASVLEFRYRFAFNAQHFLIKRSFIEQNADVGPLYQSPYPDFFAAIVMFMRARSIVVIPEPSVIIGISPRSFGAYYFSSRDKEGYEFLDNERIDPEVLAALHDTILPGNRNNTYWLIAAETARRALALSHPLKLDLDRYAMIQINSILRYRYVDKRIDQSTVAAVGAKLSGRAFLLFAALDAAIGEIAGAEPDALPSVLDAMDRVSCQYPVFDHLKIDLGGHSSILNAFDWMAGKESERRRSIRALWNNNFGYVKLRRLARELALGFLPPVRRLHRRASRNEKQIALLEAKNAELRKALEGQVLDKTAEVSGQTAKQSVISSEIDAFEAMSAELSADDPMFLPSVFWRDLNRKNLRMLEAEGLSNFKRTVAQNYFNWFIADSRHPFFRYVFEQWRRRPNLLPLLTRLKDIELLRLMTADERIEVSAYQKHMHRLYVCFVWTVMMQHDRRNLRQKAREPKAGNPFRVMYGRRLLTQDLANSIIECNIIADLIEGVSAPRIGELGAGYGRVAHLYANAMQGKYFIFDIPPALAVAQWYLEQTLGPERVFRFRHFERIEDVQSELDRSSVVLLTPNQMKKFPTGYFDVMVSISTLPEMRLDQANFYLKEFQRLSRKSIFLKQWRDWRNPDDGTYLTVDSYDFAPEWRLEMDRVDPVIPDFFNRVWNKSHE
jgi:putative sugar O-methyltransferase